MFNAIRLLWGIPHNVHGMEGWNVLNVSPREISVHFIIPTWFTLSYITTRGEWLVHGLEVEGLAEGATGGVCCWSGVGGNRWATAPSNSSMVSSNTSLRSKNSSEMITFGNLQRKGELLNFFPIFFVLYFLAFFVVFVFTYGAKNPVS